MENMGLLNSTGETAEHKEAPHLEGLFFVKAFADRTFAEAAAAFCARSVRSSGVILVRAAFPPIRPSFTACGFFFVMSIA
jgi:hypothetical protein